MNAICEADEFKSIRWKPRERDVFRDLNKDNFIAYPIKGTVTTTAQKVSLLVQVELGKVDLSNVPPNIRRPMIADTRAVIETMHRLVRAIIECKASDSDGVACRVALELERSISAGAWEGRSIQLTQVPQVGPVLMRKFVAAGITTVRALAGTVTADIERIASRNPPFGKKMLDDLSAFPSLTLETRITANKPRNHGEAPVARIDAVLGCSNTKGKPKWRGKIPSVTFMAETTEGELAYWWRGSLRKFKDEDGNKMSLHFEVQLNAFTEEVICHFACDEVVGTILSRTLHHNLPVSAFPPKLSRQSSAESGKPAGKIPATTSWLDDEIDDDDLLDVLQVETSRDQDRDYSDALEDEDLWTLIDREGNVQRTENSLHKEDPTKQSERGHSRTEGDRIPWQPVQLPNGKYKCNHQCADAGIKSSGRACTHKCCREGVEKPRRPKKASSKRKAEDDEVTAASAPTNYSAPKQPAKRVDAGGCLKSEARISHYTPVKDLSLSISMPSNFLMDLDGFDVDDEGLIDLTRAESASDDDTLDRREQPIPGCSQFKPQNSRHRENQVRDEDNIFGGISDTDLQQPFKSTLVDRGTKTGETKGKHVGLQKRQSANITDFSGGSVFDDGYAIDESDVQFLDDNSAESSRTDWRATSSPAMTKKRHHLVAKSRLDKKKDSPKKPAPSKNPPIYSGVVSDRTQPKAFGTPNYFQGEVRDGEDFWGFSLTGASDSIDSPYKQEDSAGWSFKETEEEVLASMSDIFSDNFAGPSASGTVVQEANAIPLHSSLDEHTPIDTDVIALKTPQGGGGADEGPAYGPGDPKEPKRKYDWLTEAEEGLIGEYLDLVEIID